MEEDIEDMLNKAVQDARMEELEGRVKSLEKWMSGMWVVLALLLISLVVDNIFNH